MSRIAMRFNGMQLCAALTRMAQSIKVIAIETSFGTIFRVLAVDKEMITAAHIEVHEE